ncbi:MAG: septum formation protein Maf [Melioribacteraceae bacterium]|jgi:septum formation protein|nr:septum formation protein Maf [Melioribacteraceae bacterium]
MISTTNKIYLASKSPRRRKLLKQLGIKFKSFSVDLDEEILDGEHPIKTVKRLSLQKMEEAKKRIKSGVIITADTIVVLDKEIIGKPRDSKEAVLFLKKLSGKTHTVFTGFTIFSSYKEHTITQYVRTNVKFRKITNTEIDEYVKGGSPMDKAGAYGIQDDFGAVFVEKINGCYYNVVGLPLAKLYKSLIEIL